MESLLQPPGSFPQACLASPAEQPQVTPAAAPLSADTPRLALQTSAFTPVACGQLGNSHERSLMRALRRWQSLTSAPRLLSHVFTQLESGPARRTHTRLLAPFASHTHIPLHTLARSRTPQALPTTRALPLVTGPHPSTHKQISS